MRGLGLFCHALSSNQLDLSILPLKAPLNTRDCPLHGDGVSPKATLGCRTTFHSNDRTRVHPTPSGDILAGHWYHWPLYNIV